MPGGAVLKWRMRYLLLVLALAAGGGTALGQDDPWAGAAASLEGPEFLPVERAFVPSVEWRDDALMVHWRAADGYYLYRHGFAVRRGGGELAVQVLGDGRRQYDRFFDRELEIYYGEVGLRLPLEGLAAGELRVHYQGCADAGLCYAPDSYILRIDPQRRQAGLRRADATAAATKAADVPGAVWWLALILAAAGGLVLNLMPCVFPMLSIKALQLVRGQDLRGYALGVFVAFLALGVAALGLRQGGAALGWGFHLQSPLVVVALLGVLLWMGLCLSGLVQFGARLMGVGGGASGGFGTGVLAVVVASPCTAPFMVAALGAALAAGGALVMWIFAAMAAGFVAPMAVLAGWPRARALLPAPGPWMERFKQWLAWPMYFSCLWLLWVLSRQLGGDGALWVLAAAMLVVCLAWVLSWMARGWRRHLIVAALALAALGSAGAGLDSTAPVDGAPFRLAQLDRVAGGAQPVFVNVTAAWCITCLVNERAALGDAAVRRRWDEAGVLVMTADWTNADPQVSALLARHGQAGVPMYLWYPAGDARARRLPQILTASMLLELAP